MCLLSNLTSLKLYWVKGKGRKRASVEICAILTLLNEQDLHNGTCDSCSMCMPCQTLLKQSNEMLGSSLS